MSTKQKCRISRHILDAGCCYKEGSFRLSFLPCALPEFFTVRFTPSVDFTAGDAITIKGRKFTIKTRTMEEPLGKLFAAGAVVQCDIDMEQELAFITPGGEAQGSGVNLGSALPEMNGAASAGSSTNVSREDHIHPSDTSRAPLDSPALTGEPTAPTPTSTSPATAIATKEYVEQAMAKVATGGSPARFITATGTRQVTIKAGTILQKPDGSMHVAIAPVVLNTASSTAGADFSITLNNSGTFSIVQGAPTDGSVVVGGFHTLCVSAGSGMAYTEGGVSKSHPLNGYVAGDILPASVWCLNHRPYSSPDGMVFIDSLGFWCDIYLASGTGAATKSAYQGTITRTRQIGDFMEEMFLVGKELLDDSEFAAAMLGSNEQTAVAGASEAGATTGGAGGRADSAGRRMISVYGVEEGCGSLWQFLRHCTTGGSAAWATQSGGKGSFYQTNAVLAGGAWSRGAYCGSRARAADAARSGALASCGGRGRSRHMATIF